MMKTSMPQPVLRAPVNDGESPWLTRYFWRDDSEYTIREYDYRLRWTIQPNDNDVDETRASVEVWSKRDQRWSEVWTIIEETTYRVSDEQEQGLLDRLAEKAAEVLLP